MLTNTVRFMAACVFLLMDVKLVTSAEWVVFNDHSQTFTIYVSPENNPNSVSARRVPPNEEKVFPLGSEPHIVRAYSGGVQYGLGPTNLGGERTNLSTIWTPRQERRNGRRVYNYMNQDGFFEDEGRRDRIDQSIWVTSYRTPGGRTYETDLKFSGTSGTYDGGSGELSNVTYQSQGGTTVIRGEWKHGRSQGRFQFFLKGRNEFTSSSDGRRGSWWGKSAERP